MAHNYAQGVKTNVLFFTRSTDEAPRVDATVGVWIYDMRTGAPTYGKTSPLNDSDFTDFLEAFGDASDGSALRTDTCEAGRFRYFTRAEIAARGDNLDILWLKDTSGDPEDGLETPEEIVAAIELHLANAMVELRGLIDEMDDGGSVLLLEAAE